MGFERIVVGMDGSEEARAALSWAVGEIGDGELFAVYGLSQWAEMAWASIQVDPSLILGEASSLLRDAWCEPADEAGVSCERVTHEDEPATALLEVADKVNADLIAVGSHSHARWTPHYLGSVASKLLHRSRRPVAIVPRPHETPEDSRREIVVGVDGSEASRVALAWAIDQAVASGRRVRAVWVINQLVFYASAWAPAVDMRQVEDDTKIALDELVDRELGTREQPIEVGRAVFYDDPAVRLIDESRRSDLLVLGIGHPEYMPELVIGSVPRRCATQSECPVVFVPATEHA
jgi:nucleotide-binding universal stress UspA family protein